MCTKRQKDKFRTIILLVWASVMMSCSTGIGEGMIIFTEVPQKEATAQGIWERMDIAGARLMAYRPGSGSDPVELSGDFYSAGSPQISYDGKNMLFAAQKEAGSKWQIWEMDLESRKVRQITSFPEDCVSPAYLPGGRFIFSRLLTNNTVKTSYVLFAGHLDGTGIEQVTFSPQSFAGTVVLHDGRALSTVKEVYPEEKKNKLMVLRPDGTKVELFYKGRDGCSHAGKARESNDGRIWFVENNPGENKGEVVALNYSNPARTRDVLLSGRSGEFGFVSPYKENGLLLSKTTEKGSSVLCRFDRSTSELTEILETAGIITDAVTVGAYERPKNLPSEVNPEAKTGLLVCQNINFEGLHSLRGETGIKKATKVEILGVGSSLGVVDVEEDGSFYLKIDADVPFRIRTLTDDGEVVNGPGSWYYIRPNERRGCVGCHTGPNVAPFNRQPLSVKKEPVVIHN